METQSDRTGASLAGCRSLKAAFDRAACRAMEKHLNELGKIWSLDITLTAI